MSKWYRPSLSLASKCRLGFAGAVLLIVSAGLFVPYRWMDKLVEQGKLELAQAEVHHVLAGHFGGVGAGEMPAQRPPLALSGAKGEIEPADWSGDLGLGRGGREVSRYMAVDGGREEVLAEDVGRRVLSGQGDGQPLTAWIRIEAKGEMGSEGSYEPVEAGGGSGSDMVGGTGQADGFVRDWLKEFGRDNSRQEVFKLHWEGGGDFEDDRTDSSFRSRVRTILPWAEPARYLRAVRANRSCVSGGCHGGSSVEPAGASGGSPVGSGRWPGAPIFTEGELLGVISVILPAGQTSVTLLFNRIFIIVGGLLSSICAVVTFYLITQWFILRPVRQLRQAADHVTAGRSELEESGGPVEGAGQVDLRSGRFSWQEAMSVMANIKTGDEFEDLAGAFHQMLARLKLAQDRLEETNRALDMRLGELAEKNVALYESNKLKSEFLTNVSHELRTPLNAILGFAEIIQERAASGGDDKSVRYVSNVLQSGKLLLAMINDLLDFAKIEAGKVEVRWGKCSLEEIVEVLQGLTRPQVEEKQLNVNFNISKKVGLIESDASKVQQIFFNLLSNAIKFTPQRGRIDVSARLVGAEEVLVRVGSRGEQADGTDGLERGSVVGAEQPTVLELRVADSGPGIAEEDREKIFEKFRQLDASITKEYSGTGLGLAIVKELAQILGGTVRVGGRQGHGAVFTVLLPTRRDVVLTEPGASIRGKFKLADKMA